MTEILDLLSASWPGLIAVIIWKGPDYLNVWVTSRRVRLRLEDTEIDAPNPKEARRLLGRLECGDHVREIAASATLTIGLYKERGAIRFFRSGVKR
ncbi:hypothetical protein [Sinorhizobium arboris]|uniref:hypothetical protein n=1 Tax=Sinorhizobium arboris TaxID=76745 RepID=UPI00124345BE|nr:hypothetical protein [Sinorhizobium arboris]